MIRFILRTFTATALILGLMTLTPAEAGGGKIPHRMPWMVTPCMTEDSHNCYWDSHSRENGKGQSFYAILIKGKVCRTYWNRAYGRKHDRCILR